MGIAIKVEGLGKRFLLGQTFESTLSSKLGDLLHGRGLLRRTPPQEEFWALRDVNFEIAEGEAVGIIGGNGAGKSTLLKVLSRITPPTMGRALVKGRLSSLLEVGTGFHPELTGRENVFLNGAILGMRKAEVERKFDEIVAFAGVEKFIDTPVKRYSSGMYVRLAFAVAANLEPDVLVIDEVLAVGDIEFQKRCLGKMEEVTRNGRTVLFVSHNLGAVRNLCRRGVLLSHGKVEAVGAIEDVLDAYADSRGSVGNNRIELLTGDGDEVAFIRRVEVTPYRNDGSNLVPSDATGICMDIECMEDAIEVAPFIHCHDEHHHRVFSAGSFFDATLLGKKLSKGWHRFTCTIPQNTLNAGRYSLDVMLVLNRKHVIANEQSLLSFVIQDESLSIEGWHWFPTGVVRPKLAWGHSSLGVEVE